MTLHYSWRVLALLLVCFGLALPAQAQSNSRSVLDAQQAAKSGTMTSAQKDLIGQSAFAAPVPTDVLDLRAYSLDYVNPGIPLPTNSVLVDLLTEDFSGGIPAAWATSTGGTTAWAATTNAAYGGGTDTYAGWDDDAAGNGSVDPDVIIESPSIVTTGFPNIFVQFDYSYRPLGGDTYAFEFSTDGGTVWQTAVADLPGTPTTTVSRYPNGAGIDYLATLPAAAGNQADLRLRWRYDDAGGWQYYGSLDNVRVTTTSPITPVAASFGSTTTVFQNTSTDFQQTTESFVIVANVVVDGNTGTVPLTSMTFNTTGTTSDADLANARVLYTGASTTVDFDNSPEFGTPIVNPSGTMTFTGTQALPPGDNNFFLVYEAAATAVIGNLADAEYTNATVDGTPQTPTVTTLTGALTISEAPPPPPPNDNLANATIVTPGTYTGTNVAATPEAGETAGTCGDTDQASSVWWSYTPTADGTATFSLLGSDFDTVMSLWTGTTFPLTQVGCNDDSANGGVTSLLTDIPMTMGTTYYIRVAGFVGFGNDTGAISLEVTDTTLAPVSQTLSDGAGWRILSAPVTGVTVGTLADINLVQSVIGQYPDFPNDNLFLDFNGAFVAAENVTDEVTPGRGFFWYLFDQDIDPDDTAAGGGTSQSYTLATRPLTATGQPLDANTSETFVTDGTNTFFMGGNPFATAMTADGITADVSIQNDLQLYGPNGAGTFTYTTVPRTAATTLSTWQGFFFEQTTAGTDVVITYDAATRVAGNGTIVGKSAPSHALALTLSGEIADGRIVADEAAMIRITDEATTGWDADDASKLIPPSDAFALLAPVGERDGATYRQAILSVPATQEFMTVAFVATHAGTYTVSAEMLDLPEETTVEFRDIVTGAVSDLSVPYTFESDATDWTDRFVVQIETGNIVSNEETAITEFALAPPAPNPTSSASVIRYDVPEASTVSVTLYDLLGRRVAVLAEGDATVGQHEARLDADSLAPGVYVVRMQAGSFLATQRVTVIR